ncbi:hypothetical protein [Streptomyces halobius]|uniref:Uncharacterized protein n=1 Tax=Streptomyces halobius TaxID=2879846 RepID=A0ABY4M7G2_9ACTN|nr:hypothetical protein [Streptomyces halobius]UQA93696.1 hypothetical protein K9S39_19150 [Streptomyces halobius]
MISSQPTHRTVVVTYAYRSPPWTSSHSAALVPHCEHTLDRYASYASAFARSVSDQRPSPAPRKNECGIR